MPYETFKNKNAINIFLFQRERVASRVSLHGSGTARGPVGSPECFFKVSRFVHGAPDSRDGYFRSLRLVQLPSSSSPSRETPLLSLFPVASVSHCWRSGLDSAMT